MIENYIKYRLIASDLDGTLFDSMCQISPENLDAIKELHKNNIKFILMTGRPLQNTLNIARNIGVPFEYYVASSGAVVLNEKGEIIREIAISYENAKKIQAICLEFNVEALWVTEMCVYHSRMTDTASLEKYLREHNLISKYTTKIDPSWKILKTSLRIAGLKNSETEAYKKFIKKLQDATDNSLYFGMVITDQGFRHLEITHIEGTKGAALKWIAESNNIPLEKTIATGDSGNDIPMLKMAGISFAPINATEDAKAAANVVLKYSNNESIIEKIITYLKNKK